jgi:hypothetical protein
VQNIVDTLEFIQLMNLDLGKDWSIFCTPGMTKMSFMDHNMRYMSAELVISVTEDKQELAMVQRYLRMAYENIKLVSRDVLFISQDVLNIHA